MLILLIVLLVIFGLFAFVVAVGAPYLPTQNQQREAALDLLDLKKGQLLCDLGCGDGALLLAAAGRGIRAVGYEINPLLVLVTWLRGRRYRGLVQVHWANFWHADISDADAVFVFLIDHHMRHLDSYMNAQFSGKSVKLASYAFLVPGRQPAAKSHGVFLYKY